MRIVEITVTSTEGEEDPLFLTILTGNANQATSHMFDFVSRTCGVVLEGSPREYPSRILENN